MDGLYYVPLLGYMISVGVVTITRLLTYFYRYMHITCISTLFCLDPQCATLVRRTKGLEMLCYNGYNYTTGEAYEGDTCSFTCSSGYELTGSLTRTCQSDGSWSGSDTVCSRGNIHLLKNRPTVKKWCDPV